MASSLAEASRMIAAAGSGGALLMVGQSQRYLPQYRAAKEIAGELGRLFQVRATIGHGGPQEWSSRGNWFFRADLAGLGVIGDLGVHKADMLRFLTGLEVRRVSAFKASHTGSEVEDNFVAVLEFAGGALGTLSGSWTTRGGPLYDLVLVGEKGTLRIDREEAAPLVLHRATGAREVVPVTLAAPDAEGVLHLAEVPEFVQAIRGERPNPVPGEEGYKALEICLAIDRSAREGRGVELPLDPER